MRIYVPATLDLLRRYDAAGEVPAAAERYVAPGEDEESEYAALEAAAADSGDLLDGPGRRVVLVAEVADADAVVPLRELVAVHVDTEDVDPSSGRLPELGWFATQEIPALLDS